MRMDDMKTWKFVKASLLSLILSVSFLGNAHAALVLTDVGADEFLKIVFNNDRATADNHFYLRLFCTDVTPAQTGITYVQCSGGGYAAKTLSNGSWTVTVGNDPSDAVYTEQDFTFTGTLTTNGTVYGYYVTDGDGVVLWAEKFATTFTPTANGDKIKMSPKFQMSSGTIQ
jgi:hypothetical protein